MIYVRCKDCKKCHLQRCFAARMRKVEVYTVRQCLWFESKFKKGRDKRGA